MQLSSNALESHSRCATKQRDEWRGCSLAQRMSQDLKCTRDNPQTRPPTIYSLHERIWLLPDNAVKNVMTGRVRSLQDKQQQCASERDVAVTRRASPNDRTRCTRRPIGVQRAPIATGRVRSHVIGRAARPISSPSCTAPMGVRPDEPVPRGTRRAGSRPSCARVCLRFEPTGRDNRVRSLRPQRPVTVFQ
jgi:hypothetical protein